MTINRREFAKGAVGASAWVALDARTASAATTVLDLYSPSDANVTDWLTNSLSPAFKKAHPDLALNVVLMKGRGGVTVIAERALAALRVKKNPEVDLMEELDPRVTIGAIQEGLYTKFDAGSIPNYGRLNKVTIDTPYGLPWRGSQVVLAYNGEKIATPPKSWDELTKWIAANPGQFIYGRPDRGGSGRNFVVRAIHEANGRDPAQFKADAFSKADAETRFAKAWKLLTDLAPNLYGQGAYTAGNTPTLQLLASGAVSMIPAWSDQALQGISQGVLSPATKLVQLQDLAFCGQFSQAVVPSNAAHHDGAMTLANFLLSDEVQASVAKDLGGFPAIALENLPKDLQAKLVDVVPKSIPVFPTGDWEGAMNDGWYRNVAPKIDRTAK
jgi:putative spermidine/putrescine transport system substrate-binding protein